MTHHANHPGVTVHWWQKRPAEALALGWAVILVGLAAAVLA